MISAEDADGNLLSTLRGIANFDDFFRPIRNYFYWEPHCYNIPICWALRSICLSHSIDQPASDRAFSRFS